MSELRRLLALLAARTKPDGSPRKGYKRNVAAIRARLAELAALDTGVATS